MNKSRSIILPLVFFVLAVAFSLLAWQLGQWQTTRAQEKIETQRLIAKQSNMTIANFNDSVALSKPTIDMKAWLYRPLQITGNYLESETIYIDNVIYQGQAGVTVITPLEIPETGEVILVERGWFQWQDRNNEPYLDTVSDVESRIAGRFKPVPQTNSYINNTVNLAMPSVVLEISEEVIFQQFGTLNKSIVPAIFVLDVSEPNLTNIPWLIKDDSWISRHKGYAFQWVIIGLLIWTVYIVMLYRFIRAKTKQPN